MKKALITGITGQDGSYLAELLISKNYEVHGIVRRSSVSNTERIDHLIAENAVTLHDGDLSDSSKDTCTWLCAARLYISSGRTSFTILIMLDESERSPSCSVTAFSAIR